jgi:hypothetical protein
MQEPAMNTDELSLSSKEWLRSIAHAVLLGRMPVLPKVIEQELKAAGFIEQTTEIKLSKAGYTLVHNLRKQKGKQHV